MLKQTFSHGYTKQKLYLILFMFDKQKVLKKWEKYFSLPLKIAFCSGNVQKNLYFPLPFLNKDNF